MDTQEAKKQRIKGLSFHDLSDKTRDILDRKSVFTAGDLLRYTDADLVNFGIAKKEFQTIDRCLKALGLKRTGKGSDSVSRKVAVTVLGMDSIIPIGGFRGLVVRNVVDAMKYRMLRHMYYTVSYIDFTDEVKEAIGIRYAIDKPGVNKDLEVVLNDENDGRIHGRLKLKMKMAISRDMREEAEARASENVELSKAQLQAWNHGHAFLSDFTAGKKKRCPKYDLRPFAAWIREHGYDIPRKGGHRAVAGRAVALELKKLHDTFLSGSKPTLVLEGEKFIANLLFLELVDRTRPQDMETAEGVLFTEFRALTYFLMLGGMELDRATCQDMLSKRTFTFHGSIVKDPETGSPLWVKGWTLENNVNREGFPQPTFLNEDTYERVTPLEFFSRARAYSPASVADMPEDGIAITLDRFEAVLKGICGDDGYATQEHYSGRGVHPRTYQLRVNGDDGSLSVRIVDGKRNGLFLRWDVFCRENPRLIDRIYGQLRQEVGEGSPTS